MSIEWIAGAIAILGNIGAWAYTYGKLNQKVITLSDTLQNGLCAKVNTLSVDVACLKVIIEDLARQINNKR